LKDLLMVAHKQNRFSNESEDKGFLMDITMVSSVLKYNGKRHPKIDLHAHFLPEAYLAALELQGEKDPDGFPTPAWSAEDHVRFMDKLGIDCSFLSISSPHINFGDRQQSALLARKVNDFAAGLARAYPGRFGVMASLPVPYVEESVEEIRYCRKTLSVDGFALPPGIIRQAPLSQGDGRQAGPRCSRRHVAGRGTGRGRGEDAFSGSLAPGYSLPALRGCGRGRLLWLGWVPFCSARLP